ncbi:MAG: SelT/SelW/SelH family (seleno)protein [Planctomycetota bacterium]|nr:SelT/SelW/SelH family (seleno)protein [Planctomycetota bacterium]
MPEAVRVAAEVKQQTGEEPKLIAGGGGVFVVRRDEEILYNMQECSDFPKDGEIAELLKS